MHTRIDQIDLQIQHDMGKDALGNRRFTFGRSYRIKVARQSIHLIEGDTFLGAWARRMEHKHGITIAFETLRQDEVLLTVRWVSRLVPA